MTASNEESRQAAYVAAQLENLSMRAAKSGIVLYSDFLTLPQQKMAENAAKHAGCCLYSYGGCIDSQRMIAAFAKDKADFNEADFPIVILRLCYDQRFLNQELTHRDFLGSLMGLSIRREMIGDIVIGEGETYLCVHEKSAGYVMAELDTVGKASVSVEVVEYCPLSAAPDFAQESITVSSMRLDSVAAQIMHTSRSQAVTALNLKNIRIDNIVETKPDLVVREGQEISLRGYGKYRIGNAKPTRKGRLSVTILKYQ